MATKTDLDEELVDDIADLTWDPLGYAMYNFPWGEEGTALEDSDGPRDWQIEELEALGEHLRNPETRYTPYQLAIASGHGIGKSAFIGMLSAWAMDTCDDCRIVCTSNTDGQLKTKTVPEVTKWHKLGLTAHWKVPTATAIFSKERGREKSWRMDFTPWSKENSEAFAGLHNKSKRIVVIFDEASAIHDKIWEVVEGALTDEDTEIIWIAFGNPTRNVGRFRECFRKYSKYWRTRHIDSRTVKGTNKKLFERWAKQYGEDSDFFKVRCRGMFPAQSAFQLFSMADLDRARGRHYDKPQYDFAPIILTCDPAWTGEDELVIGMRQGLVYRVLARLPKNENDVRVANLIARFEDELEADAVFVDGGYGTGIISAGRTMGRHWIIVWFSEKPARNDCVNKRDEMHVLAAEWLKEGGSFPADDEHDQLYEEMIACEVMPTLDGKYKIPPKDDMREVIGRSPNDLDALCLSFAMPVTKRLRGLAAQQTNIMTGYDHDPMG